MNTESYLWPLPGIRVDIPTGSTHPGAFGAVRKYDVHTGIDLYAPLGQHVVAIEAGTVVAIEPLFTGGADTPLDTDGTPIWLPTSAVLIEGKSGVIAYGEIDPEKTLHVGRHVTKGEPIGTVLQVLKPKRDGKPFKNPANSPTMLHIELYKHGSRKTVYWRLGEPQPDSLLDPTEILTHAVN